MTKDESNSKHMETGSNRHSEDSYFESRDRAFSRGSSASSASASSANGNSPNGHSSSTLNGEAIYDGSANGRTINGDSWSESWDECFSYEDGFLPEYHPLDLSVSRMEEGEQTASHGISARKNCTASPLRFAKRWSASCTPSRTRRSRTGGAICSPLAHVKAAAT